MFQAFTGQWHLSLLSYIDWVSYLLHAPSIIQNTRFINLWLSSYKMQLDGLLVVYGLVLSAINH